MASVLSARIAEPGQILVPGCGTGTEILALASSLPQARFTALDPSTGMLAAARAKVEDMGIGSRISFAQGFLHDFTHDLHEPATLSLVLHFLPDDGAKFDLLKGIAARLTDDAPLLLLDAVATDDDDEALRIWLLQQGHRATEVQVQIPRQSAP